MFPTFSNFLNILKCYQPLTMFSTFSNFLNILKCSQPLQMFSTTKLGTTLHHTTQRCKKRPFSDLVLILELCTHAPMPSTPVLSAPVISLQIFWKNLDRQCWKYLLKVFVESPPFGDNSPGLCRPPAGPVERSFGEFGQRFRPSCSSNCSLTDNLLHIEGTKN